MIIVILFPDDQKNGQLDKSCLNPRLGMGLFLGDTIHFYSMCG